MSLISSFLYECQRLDLPIVPYQSGRKIVLDTEGRLVTLKHPHAALREIWGVSTDAPWPDKANAMTKCLAYAE